MRFHPVLLSLLLTVGAVQGCAAQNEASRAAELAAEEGEDVAACREKSGADKAAYEACRKAMADTRAQKAAVQEQKRRDFDRVLGAGTDGLSSY